MKTATPATDLARWDAWLSARVGYRQWAPFSALLGKHHTYLHNMKERGCIPPPATVRDIAQLLGANEAEALTHAGYAPAELSPDEWEAILTDLRAQDRLCPELRAALRGLHGLSGSQLQEADAMLVGLARGFTLAREQRRRAS